MMKKIFWKIITILFWIFIVGSLLWKGITFFDRDFFEDLFSNNESEYCSKKVDNGAVWWNDSITVYVSNQRVYVTNHNSVCVTDSIDEIRIDFDNINTSRIWFRKGDLRGYISATTGKIDIPAQYDKAWMFREGKAAVLKDGEIFFINEQGEVILSDNWEDAGWVDFIFRNNHCVICKNDKLGLIDGDGNYIVEPKYIDIITREKGYYTMTEDFIVSRYNWNGDLEQAMCYYSIETIEDENGYTLSCLAYHTDPNHVGLMDANGNILCPPYYRRIRGITDRLYLGYRDDYDYDQLQLGELISAE